jgi:pyruvate/2-oxoglutarate dehydrogenase complex dihydrolipoamide dehydrogenase (E3) component
MVAFTGTNGSTHESDTMRDLIEPDDEHNRVLVSHVHPTDWVNPEPAEKYNLVVIGAGTAGLITASAAAGLGAKVALIERHLMGGDCLNVGCVPSKALLASAKAAKLARPDGSLGVTTTGEVVVDFPFVMARMREIRAGIAPVDGAPRYSGELGVDVFIGDATFSGKDTVEVAGATLKFKHAVIATGARAAVPPIEGLAEAGYLTNTTLFELEELPARLGVIGAGAIGCEMAQAFARFGSQVTLFEGAARILAREEAEASAIVARALTEDGVAIHTNARVVRVEKIDGATRVTYAQGDSERTVEVDALLVAAGRAPNTENLGLDAAGVELTERGAVRVNDQLQTTNRHVYAVGDVAIRHQFTHMADYSARAVIQNALFPGHKNYSSYVVPWSTYTDPEVAHTGATFEELERDGAAFDTYTQEFEDNDRAKLEGRTEGYVRVYTVKGKDEILGATVVGEHAGDLISQLTQAIVHGVGLGGIKDVIHPYPTRADAIRRLGDVYNRTKLTPRVASAMNTWLDWTR